MDVTDGASVAAGMAEAVGHLGGLDVLVYASGWASLAPLAEETEDNLRRMFETNVIGAASVVRAALPHLTPATILAFLSSTNTHRRLWGLSGYGASKAAFDRYVIGLRDEHPRLRVVRLRIGSTIGTEFGDGFDGATLTEALARWVVGGVHTARLMAVPDVASVVVGVLSLLRSHPGVDMPEVLLDPPGGLATVPVTPDVVAQAYSALED
jgi:NAD(P)-dependent dehydrogenase (short-subunit alcohol dehydrogenase family)